jgi:hydrogenase-4 component B
MIPAVVLCSFLILVIPGKYRYSFALVLTIFIAFITSVPAVFQLIGPFSTMRNDSLMGHPGILSSGNWIWTGHAGLLRFMVDPLSAFFILVTNFTVMTGMLYSRGYLRSYTGSVSDSRFALHYFSYTWLHLSMLAVLTFRSGLAFLIAWELMAVSSFMLILFEAEKRTTLKTAVNYLIQMHVGFIFLLIAFLITGAKTGNMSFDALPAYFSSHPNIGLFMLFFAGFAVKAGIMPLHTWLPDAHPAAPSHVSGVMSGVMIKMGIYGIVRVLACMQTDFVLTGWIIFVVSALSGLLGVMMAITQHDLKKLLAYHSIENIGIIGMGIGLGTIGLGIHNTTLVLLGFAGGLLHVLNHSLFKSLLFYSTGSVYISYHTRIVDELGGVIHRMPKTAFMFLAGAVAICGLPPLNGFISELLIYIGLFKGILAGNAYESIFFLLGIVSLALIGGLAIFCFTKAFGIVFLGSPRRDIPENVAETGFGMLLPQYLITALMFLIGMVPALFLGPLMNMISVTFHLPYSTGIESLAAIFPKITLVSLILIALITFLLWVRSRLLSSRDVKYGPTWGCGSLNMNERQQYTGTSYADNFLDLAQPVLRPKRDCIPITDEEFFPGKRSFTTHTSDIFQKAVNRVADLSMTVLKKLARLQTGNIRHYILYAFVFILIIFVLLFLGLL